MKYKGRVIDLGPEDLVVSEKGKILVMRLAKPSAALDGLGLGLKVLEGLHRQKDEQQKLLAEQGEQVACAVKDELLLTPVKERLKALMESMTAEHKEGLNDEKLTKLFHKPYREMMARGEIDDYAVIQQGGKE